MSITSEMLFSYLRDVIYDTPNAALDIEKLDEDYVLLGKGLVYFAQCFSQCSRFADALGKGDLSVSPPPPENELAAPLKSLHASLRHLSWQSQQVAKGDYKQRVDFMGDFSGAFNTMVEQLADRQSKLENEIELSQKKAKALEQSNQLLSNVMQYILQQIFVISKNAYEVLLMNNLATREIENDPAYLNIIMSALTEHIDQQSGYTTEIPYKYGSVERYLSVSSYHIEWTNVNAIALLIKDVSVEKKQIKELEDRAYRDALTQVFNRFYGMLTLDEWIHNRKRFSLIFVDLDNLKFVNDKYGHNEGDTYIVNVANYLSTFSEDAIVCRVGGDEFMLLAPDIGIEQSNDRMNELQDTIQSDDYLEGKDFYYSVSFGIVSVDEDNNLQPSSVLSLADERMYEHKRARKKERQ